MALEISNHSNLGDIGAAGVAQDQWWRRVFSGMVVAVHRLWNQPSFDARRLVATCLSVKRLDGGARRAQALALKLLSRLSQNSARLANFENNFHLRIV